jgi:hypothetical protein
MTHCDNLNSVIKADATKLGWGMNGMTQDYVSDVDWYWRRLTLGAC